MRMLAWGQHLRYLWETFPKRQGKVSMYMTLAKGEDMHSSTHFFFFLAGLFCSSQGSVITMKDFSAFLDMRQYKNWAHTISFWKYLSEDLFCQVFPEHRQAHSCSPSWTPFRGYCRPAAAAAHDLILVEVNGRHPGQPFAKENMQEKTLLCKKRLLGEAPGGEAGLSWCGETPGVQQPSAHGALCHRHFSGSFCSSQTGPHAFSGANHWRPHFL